MSNKKLTEQGTSLGELIEKIFTQLEGELGTIGEELNRTKVDLEKQETALTEVIKRNHAQLDEKLEETKRELAGQLSQTKTDLEKQETALTEVIKRNHTELDEKLEETKKELTEQLNQTKADLEKEHTTLVDKLDETNETVESLRIELVRRLEITETGVAGIKEEIVGIKGIEKEVCQNTNKVFRVFNSYQIGKNYLEWKFSKADSEQAKKLSLLGYLGYYMTDQNQDFGKILISSFIAFKQEHQVPMSDDERKMWQAICGVSEELGNALELLEAEAGEKFSRTGMVALDEKEGRKVKEFYAFGCKGGPRPLVSVE